VARIVERKKGTITIAEAPSRIHRLPWFLLFIFSHTRTENASQYVMPMLAVFCTAYAFGRA
jgi:hypothetical protein